MLAVYAPSLPALAATTTSFPLSLLFKLRNACWGVKPFVGTGSQMGVNVACMGTDNQTDLIIYIWTNRWHMPKNPCSEAFLPSYYEAPKETLL